MPRNLKIITSILALFVVVMNLQFAPGKIISWDVYGYYLYLPTTFIYHDLGMENVQVILDLLEEYQSSGSFYQALKMPEGNYVMKYSMGMAVLFAPFFFMGMLWANLFSYPVDGFSLPFEVSIWVGGMFYSIVGLWALAKVLNHFFTTKIAILTLLVIVIGTNYMVHVTMYGQNAMSHNYLFTGYALVLWWTIQWHKKQTWKYSVLLALTMGLMVLARPTEIVVVLIPLLWNVFDKESFENKKTWILQNLPKSLVMIAVFGSFGVVQLVYWKVFTGHFMFNSYGGNAGEGLELLSPYTREFLFSFRKGWLIYTPLMAFSIIGIFKLKQKHRPVYGALLVFMVLNIYLISSWSNWWYADSFSQRAIVSSYPIMAVGFASFLEWLMSRDTKKRMAGFTLIGLLVGFNVFQTIQFNNGVIHSNRMTRAYYFQTFGQLHASEEDKKLLLVNRTFKEFPIFENEQEYSSYVLKELSFEDGNSKYSKSGCCAMKLVGDTLYSEVVEAPFHEISSKDHVWFRITANVFVEKGSDNVSFSLVGHFDHKGGVYSYRTTHSSETVIIPGEWNKIQLDLLSPEVRNTDDQFRAFVWDMNKNPIWVDDFRVEVFEKKE